MVIRCLKLIFLFQVFCLPLNADAQPVDNDAKLAAYYYDKGEFAKAEIYYEKLHKQYKSKTYFERYFMCLFYQQKFDDCEDLVEKQIKRDPYDIDAKFLLAMVYEETDRQKDADAIYQKLIDDLEAVQTRVEYLGTAFRQRGKLEYALQTYLKGKEMLKKGYAFQLELADIYSQMNEPAKMIEEYLNLLDYSPSYLKTVQTYLTRAIDFTEEPAKVEMLRIELLERVQTYPDADHYSEMMIWFYLQKKEFSGAVIQAKAYDKRKGLNGKKVYEVAQICQYNKAYDAAVKAYQYIVELGKTNPYYSLAIEGGLKIEFILLTDKANYTDAELEALALRYEEALTNLGKSQQTLGLMIQLAKIYAFYLNQPVQAERVIKEALALPLNPKQKAELKVLLGDIYVVSNRIWDASLLYMQVEKDFSEDIIGHEAKFKNACVFYYDGEFEYAKAQLDVLKASTSKLIANDAMQLSLLLQDNLGIDTTRAPVQIFAHADLFIQQHKYDSALFMLDSLTRQYPFHNLADEVLFRKGEIMEKQHNWTAAIEYYIEVYEAYGHDILADDAVIRIARIYDFKLEDKTKAAEFYRKILFEFTASIHGAEARERYTEIQQAQ
ncbi:MAG: tetratricopeptide repeat protein [Crocinitomicaceae bacterium]|nr:tetratricopeptide repeat protein [Crocinitomicaceae bacterium]